MDTLFMLLRLLADGQFHSGEELAGQLGCTRSAVCKMVQKLNNLSIATDRIPNRGYR